MTGDIAQDRYGWFFHDNGDGTYDNLSGDGEPHGDLTVLVRDGEPTGDGDPLATRVAVMMAKRDTSAA
jgi:hypothetical protein